MLLRLRLICLYLFSMLVTQVRMDEQKLICNTIDIKKTEDFERLHKCNIIVGHISITNVQIPAVITPTDIEEITDYLLVYRVHGLESLRSLFPNLVIIRGKDLLFDKYALIIYENLKLLNLGLVSLLRIQHGDVRIESNPLLCYTHTVNWLHILGNNTKQHYVLKNNKPPSFCAICILVNKKPETEEEAEFQPNCWDFEVPQNKLRNISYNSRECPTKCGFDACTITGNCCSRDCLSDCSTNACSLCANFMIDGKCTDACNPPYYQFNKRLCIGSDDCRSKGMIPFAGICTKNCPKNYQEIKTSNGQRSCTLNCTGNYVVETVEGLETLRDCKTLHGSLTIQLSETKSKIVNHLEEVFMNLKEITGYLKVTHSPQIVSLSFLRNLHSIGGNVLIDNHYALYIVNNIHMENIWSHNQKVAILKGFIYIHLNPRLCFEKILQLKSSLKQEQKITIQHSSPNSNGERIVCGEGVQVLNATVEDFNATAARIKVDIRSVEDMNVLLGYVHYYKEAPVRNVSMYDGRHGCGRDHWNTDVTINRNIRHVIKNLKPYTQYAYFVKTLSIIEFHWQIEAYSKIQYFRTLPSTPGPVGVIFYHSLTTTELVLHWWPPKNPNGVINKYMIYYEKVKEKILGETVKNFTASIKSKPKAPDCICMNLDTENSGAVPNEENFYNKNELTYDEALSNFVYVSRASTGTNKSFCIKKPKNTTEELNEILPVNATQNSTSSKSADINDKMNAKLGTERLLNYSRELELKSLAEQDTGIADYLIMKPLPICNLPFATVQHQLENSCKPQEYYEGFSVAGNYHSYILTGLQPEVTYRVSVRACVEGLRNACGPTSSILAETVSKSLANFFKQLKLY
ncbi:insulin-like receptor [Teleopsis dalmanni]|uniref:insulin-like receptor n=1 Tax=Teleopsis dalmanni TaxID=139649 RepID=UPI0018CEF666|nr:insulin-like receptor [Teleopsis dalmanni]